MKRAVVASFRGVVRDRAVVFETDPGLPDGTPVVVTAVQPAVGTPRAVLAAVAAGPRVADEDVAELLAAIGKGRRPIRFENPLG